MNEFAEKNDLKVKFNRAVSQRLFIPKSGFIEDFNQDFKMNNINVIFSNININKGKKTQFPEDHTKRLGCVIASGTDKNDAIKNAKSYIKNLQVKYKKLK